jgi:hypothetical protein
MNFLYGIVPASNGIVLGSQSQANDINHYLTYIKFL